MSQTEPTLPWPRVVRFIGQLSHDIRNHLNAIELQSAFIGEIVEEPEAKAEVKRLREMTAEVGVQLRRLSELLAKVVPTPMPYQAAEFVEDLRAKVAALYPQESKEIEWGVSLGKEGLEIDPQLLLEAFSELFGNALAHSRGQGKLVFEAGAADSSLVFRLQEPKAKWSGSTENWGAQPLSQLRHGHYALGLFRARSIFEGHHGSLQAKFDPAASALVTTVTLPLA